jgi:hypothetical protein
VGKFLGFSVVKLIIIGALLAVLAGLLIALNNLLYHHYVDPQKEIWDRSEAVYKANEQTLKEANARLDGQFKALETESARLTDEFKAKADQAKADADAAIVKAKLAAKISQPKIDELVRQTKEATPVLEVQAKVHKLLVEYAADVQKIRDMLGLTQ